MYYLTLTLFCCMTVTFSEKIQLDLYLESKCSDTDGFIKQHLVPAVDQYGSQLNIDYIIYGKVIKSSSGEFRCQHGTQECEMNQVQLCGVKHADSDQSAVCFVSCTQMKNTGSIERCASRCGLNAGQINTCFNDKTGEDLFKRAGEKTKTFTQRLTYVPTVVINGVQNNAARTNLSNEIQKILQAQDNVSSGAALTVALSEKIQLDLFLESQCPDTDRFIQYQLVPTVQQFGDKLSIDYIIYGKVYEQSSGQLMCQHGTQECEMNQVQLCGVKHADSDQSAVCFVSCTQMQDTDVIQRCAKKCRLNAEQINTCFNEKIGEDLFKKAGVKTKALNPRLNYVPSVAINGVQNTAARDNLSNEIQKILQSQ